MTVSMAERRTGYHVFCTGDDHPEGIFYAAFERENGTIICEAHGKDQKEALKALCDLVYKIHSAMVRSQQEGKCADCGLFKPLELDIDHIVRRSKGRVDAVENLRALCRKCHKARHRRPDPRCA